MFGHIHEVLNKEHEVLNKVYLYNFIWMSCKSRDQSNEPT